MASRKPPTPPRPSIATSDEHEREPGMWERGGPSPNPRGRPFKRKKGPVSSQMDTLLDAQVSGVPTRMTQREALDYLVQQMARIKGGRWLTLWRKRQARDRNLDSLARSKPPGDGTREKMEEERKAFAFKRAFIDRSFPGYIDAVSELSRTNALEETPDGPGAADWLDLDGDS